MLTLAVSQTAPVGAVAEADESCKPVRQLERSPAVLRNAMSNTSPILTKKPPPAFRIEFRRDRTHMSDSRILDLGPGLEALPTEIAPSNGGAIIVRHSDLFDSETGKSLPAAQFFVYGTIDTLSEQILIEVCVDPHTPETVPAGTYSGTVSLADPRFQQLDTPVVVTLQSTAWVMALTTTVIGGALGGGWGVVSSLLVKSADKKRSERPSPGLLVGVGVIVGLLAGVVMFVQGYDDKPAFRGADLGDWLNLGLTTFGAAAATYTVTLTAALGYDILRHARRTGTSTQPGVDRA